MTGQRISGVLEMAVCCALPAASLEVTGVGIEAGQFYQDEEVDNVEFWNLDAETYFSSEVFPEDDAFLNVIDIKETGVYLMEVSARVPTDVDSDFVIAVFGAIRWPDPGDPSVLDDSTNDPGTMCDYNARIGGLINGLESFLIYPRWTKHLYVDDESGVDPLNSATWLQLFPMRFGAFYGSGGSADPSASTITARLSVVRLTDAELQ